LRREFEGIPSNEEILAISIDLGCGLKRKDKILDVSKATQLG
jgi:hypothetical protein